MSVGGSGALSSPDPHSPLQPHKLPACPAGGCSFHPQLLPWDLPGRLSADPGRRQSPCPGTALGCRDPALQDSPGHPWLPTRLHSCSTWPDKSPVLTDPTSCACASFRRCLQELQLHCPAPRDLPWQGLQRFLLQGALSHPPSPDHL